MDSEQSMEGQTQVSENPHSEYGLTENVERIVENEKSNADKSIQAKGRSSVATYTGISGSNSSTHLITRPFGPFKREASKSHRISSSISFKEQITV